jgi:hypothetical protein
MTEEQQETNKEKKADDEPAAVEPTQDSDDNETPSKPAEQIVDEYEPNLTDKFMSWFGKNLKKILLALILVILLVLIIVPKTRYFLFSKFVTKNVEIEVIDSVFKLPVSLAEVRIGEKTALTDEEGRAQIRDLPVGFHEITIYRAHYEPYVQTIENPINEQPKNKMLMEPIGLQAPVIVTDASTRKPIAKARVSLAGGDYLTNKNGEVFVAIQRGIERPTAAISAEGYEPINKVITPNFQAYSQNKVFLVPAQ